MFELRDYQKALCRIGYDFLTKDKTDNSGLIVSPVGSGKSLIIGTIAAYLKEPTIVIQPSVELLYQNHSKSVSYGIQAEIYSASANSKVVGKLTYATMGSIKDKASLFKKIGVKHIIVDEADKGFPAEKTGMLVKFLKALGVKKVLGFTATPFKNRSYLTEGFNSETKLYLITRMYPRLFNKILAVVQNQEMIERSFWSPIEYNAWVYSNRYLRLNSTGSDYTEDSICKNISYNGINNKILTEIQRQIDAGKKSILVFMDSVLSCSIAKEYLDRKGVNSNFITTETTKKTRKNLVDDFRSGKINVMFNFSTLLQGFDAPAIDCIIFGRPTMSLAIWMQVVGRGVRLDPKNPNKRCLIIDCCGNLQKFGRMEDIEIEQYKSFGWGVFSGDKVLTGFPVGEPGSKKNIQ